jgi:hypothetical protein
MQKWEYLVRTDMDESDLTRYGSQGWELIAVVPFSDDFKYVFKRPAD